MPFLDIPIFCGDLTVGNIPPFGKVVLLLFYYNRSFLGKVSLLSETFLLTWT